MRFSILLPTRNGARFLEGCVRTVLAQPVTDMELVISDNASDDDTRDVLAPFLSDSRVRYERLASSVPVTDNWNNALRMSRGDYLLLIGDDDGLLTRCLPRVDEALRQHGEPDCLGMNGYLYVAPGSIFGNAASYYGDPYHPYFPERPAVLARESRRAIVSKMFAFEQTYPLNMQLTVVSRRIAERVRGGMFQPPFPDHYGLNALLLEAETFVTIPDKLVVVGVSPKSFGHYYFSGDHERGMEFLGADSSFPGRLPGDEIMNAMYRWLLLLKKNYPDLLESEEISPRAYRRLQVEHWTRLFRMHRVGWSTYARFLRLLPAASLVASSRVLARSIAGRIKRRLLGRLEPTIENVLGVQRLEGVGSLAEFVSQLEAGALRKTAV